MPAHPTSLSYRTPYDTKTPLALTASCPSNFSALLPHCHPFPHDHTSLQDWERENRKMASYYRPLVRPDLQRIWGSRRDWESCGIGMLEGGCLGRRWSSWKQIDEKERWRRKGKEGDREVTVDLVEDFSASLNLQGEYRGCVCVFVSLTFVRRNERTEGFLSRKHRSNL